MRKFEVIEEVAVLGSTLLAAARSDRLRRAVAGAPVARRVVDRFVAGEALSDAIDTAGKLRGQGMLVTLDHLGEDVSTLAGARASRDAYLAAVAAFAPLEAGREIDFSVKLSAFGQGLPDGDRIALATVRPVVEAAAVAGATVTLDMESSSTVDSTLAVLAGLRERFPSTGAVLQSYLFRTEGDAKALATAGSRVRLVKGAYRESPAVAHQEKAEVDAAYERCLRTLMDGDGYPMVGSHDPRMIALAGELAAGRSRDSFEFQMLYGVRPDEQVRLAGQGYRVRAYVPYGLDWYGYFIRRLAEQPANLQFFLRALVTRG